MRVIKRNLETEEVSFDKVLNRIRLLCSDIDVDFFDVAQKVCSRIYDNVKTCELDELAANICSSLIADKPDYGILAARIIISNHHKNTSPSFSETIYLLYNNKDMPLVSTDLFELVMKNKEKLNHYIDYQRDYEFDYFGFKTLERSYLLRSSGRIIERPQHLFLRVALGIHGNDIKDALQTYDLMSKKFFTHATPTLFNAGTPKPQLSSCFLLSVNGDSIEKIFDTVKECAMISKFAGGIGIHVHDVRAKGSIIKGTNGISDGIVPMLKVLNQTARYVNQCFTPDTMVYTIKGIKRMDEVDERDHVITNDGSFRKVNSISKKQLVDESIFEIKSKFSFESVRVTGEHEIYVLRDNKPVFVAVKNLKMDDYLLHHITSFVHDIPEMPLIEYRYMGIILSAGHIVKRSDGKWAYTVYVKSQVTIEFMIEFLALHRIYFLMYRENNRTVFKYLDKAIVKVSCDLSTDFKRRIPVEILHLSRQNSMYLLNGLFDLSGGYDEKKVYFSSSSYAMAHDIKYLLLRLGILTMGHIIKTSSIKEEEKEIENDALYYIYAQKHMAFINIFMTSKFKAERDLEYFEIDDLLCSTIDYINPIKYSGDVYDFNVDDNHNYTLASLGLVHNSGKRNGSIAAYLEPWHADVFEFLDLKKPHGNEEDRARDLFYALWIPDVFMERVKNNEKWSLMCPNTCPGLSDVYGSEFKDLYEKYECQGKYVKQIDAQMLWFKILEIQVESGGPYLLFKDAANKKSNQSNLGIIKSSNLCSEIIEYSSPEETAVCNLASLCLPSYIEYCNDVPFFNFDRLHEVAMVATKNLNKVIDINFYPVEKARRSNLKHRPIGIGIQGLADVYVLMRYPFDSEDASLLNKQIFETIYHAALEQSMKIAKTRHLTSNEEYLKRNEFDPLKDSKFPGAYISYEGSHVSHGRLQFDLWDVQPGNSRYDWDVLKKEISEYGVRNSLLIAPMPTASTSQIMGFNEACEAFTSNIYKRKTLAGEFIIVNKYLIRDLIRLDLWNKDMKNLIILAEGSVQNIDGIPDDIKSLYKTVWELKQKVIIDQAADRGAYICQSQSMNLFIESPSFKILSSMHFYTWSKGLKTCSYYIRSKPKGKQQQFTIEPSFKKDAEKKKVVCTEEVCTVCSS